MTKVMQIVFCFPFPSTPNWHCKIEEETLPPSFLRPLRTVSGEIRLARQKKGGDGFNPFSFRLTHHFYPITKGGLLSLRWEGELPAASPRKHAHRQAKKKRSELLSPPLPFRLSSSGRQIIKERGGGWLCGVGRKEDDGRRRRRRKSKNRTG